MPMRQHVGADKTDRQAAGPGPPGTANAVRVIHGRTRQVKVDHHRQIGDVQPAGGHVGGHHHLDARGLEIRQHLTAFALAQHAMKGLGIDAHLSQFVSHHFRRMFGGHKDQHALPFVLFVQMPQQLGALRRLYGYGPLHDVGFCLWLRFDFDLYSVVQHGLRQGLHLAGEGGRKKQVLPQNGSVCSGQCSQYPAQLFGKAQIQQAVGFVQHQGLDRGQTERIATQQIQQPARRGHHHFDTPSQKQHLFVDRDTTKQHRHLDATP